MFPSGHVVRKDEVLQQARGASRTDGARRFEHTWDHCPKFARLVWRVGTASFANMFSSVWELDSIWHLMLLRWRSHHTIVGWLFMFCCFAKAVMLCIASCLIM